MYSDETTQTFREHYRAGIHRRYNGYAHALFVLFVGVAYVVYQFQRLPEFHWYYSLMIGATLIVWNFMEYAIHIKLGHQKTRLGAMFYKRHTGDHHSFYTDTCLTPDSHRDMRVTLFPAWLVLVSIVIATLSGAVVGWLFGREWGAVYSGSLLVGYLAYEFFHFCDHLPEHHPLVQLPWIGHMRRLHQLHHRRDLMQRYNFNLTFPLADWALGTFYWEPPVKMHR